MLSTQPKLVTCVTYTVIALERIYPRKELKGITFSFNHSSSAMSSFFIKKLITFFEISCEVWQLQLWT